MSFNSEALMVDAKKLRHFGLSMAVLCPLVFGLIVPLVKHSPFRVWPFVFAILAVIVSWWRPALLKGFYRAWMALGSVLGTINTHLVMFAVYVVFFVPMGLIGRAIGRDPLGLKLFKERSPGINSYKLRHEAYRASKNLKKLF